MNDSVNILWVAIIPLLFFILLSTAEIVFESEREKILLTRLYYIVMGIYMFCLCCIPFWMLWYDGVI